MIIDDKNHGLRTPNEDINQIKFGPMWQAKYSSAVLKNLGLGVDFRLNFYQKFPNIFGGEN